MAKTTKPAARARRGASAPTRRRSATVIRTTKETSIRLTLGLDGRGQYEVSTG